MAEPPQVITLNTTNSVQLLFQHLEDLAKKPKMFFVEEVALFKSCRDVLLEGKLVQDLDAPKARQIIINSVRQALYNTGHENFNLASTINQILIFLSQNINSPLESVPVQTTPQTPQTLESQPVQEVHQDLPVESQEIEEVDLSELSEPVPLKRVQPKLI